MKAPSRQILKESCSHRVGLFGDIIHRNALLYPHREAFIFGDQRVTFEQYNERVNGLIHALWDMGMKKGDVLGVLSWNCLEYMDVFGAAEKGGFIIAPFNARLLLNDFDYLINDSEANTLFVGPEFADVVSTLKPRIPKVKHFISFEGSLPGMKCHDYLLASYPTSEPDTEVGDEDGLFICYTSGTTGRPRGAFYTRQRFREDIICHAIEVPIGPDDKGISLMPLFHIGGIEINASFIYQAATTVIMKFFDPKALLGEIEKEKITNVALVPTHLAAMLDLPDFKKYDTGTIRRIYYAGSPMPKELLLRGMEVFGPVFFQGYGQTESGPGITYLKEKEHDVLGKSPREERRLLSCGRPGFVVHVRIVDENGADVSVGDIGEIIVMSRHIMNEYWKKPQETKKTIVDGWLHTGDMGRYDEDGYIYIVDRKQDMIVSGGENIYPREVEEVLYQHPAVLECAVFSIPDPKWVESVHAAVSLKKGATVTPEELIGFCKKNIARYKAPKSIEIMPEIPKGATGKILKREMKDKYWSGR
ncbi:MAG: long-chain fatty acid--CoA ligase [Dehalococcoidia bacterium]|nr:long-chain fatty acid--CoA ligase [Dehalococcoidia bacterium]